MSLDNSIAIRCLTALLLAAAGLSGCGTKGPPTGTVSGGLMIGSKPPQEKIRVTFINNSIGQGAGATVESDGKYALESPLPPANYAVFVSKFLADTAGVSTDKEMLLSVPKEYRTADATPLKYDVKEGKNEINIEIPAAAGAK